MVQYAKRICLARVWPFVVSLVVAVGVFRVGLQPFVGMAALIVSSWLAYRFRVATTVTLAMSLLVPQLFTMITLLPEGWDSLGGGVRLMDMILVGMWGASIALLVMRVDRPRSVRMLIGASLFLMLVMLAAVARNWGTYGLSALGEFRFRFLILGLPLYLGLGINATVDRLRVARFLAWGPILGVLLALPIIGMSKGWGVGEDTRFYPSAISFALLYGAIWMGLSRESGTVQGRQGLRYGIALLAAIVIVADGHRSVWLVAVVSFAVLLWIGVVRIDRLWLWGLTASVLAVTVVGIVGLTGTDVLTYVGARGSAFFNPVADPTSYWRLSVWKAYISPWLENPLFGQGFGGYWDVYVPELGGTVTTSPHSIYVQTLVKVGLVGLGSLLVWFAVSWKMLTAGYRRATVSTQASALVTMGMLAVPASLAYGTVYALDFWSLAWMGVGLSEVVWAETGGATL